MSETTRTKITATPLYPGSFFAEDGRPIELASDDPHTAITTVDDDGSWFALDVRTTTEKLWTDGAGGELWRTAAELSRYRIYVGQALTAADIERLDDGQDYRTLLSNMRSNGWERVVRTRRGNFQPVEPGDVVVDAERLQPAGGSR
jgi:hypothetical protein